MPKKLVIVESPAKARTMGRFLGDEYSVRASIGHIRDLPQNRLGVDIENDFEPHYVIPAKKQAVVKELKAEMKGVDELYLATDPDREGEAISWHLLQILNPEKKTKTKPASDPLKKRRSTAKVQEPEKALKVQRVEFHEITKQAITEAFAHPRDIDFKRVDAQQARRILDRLVGYSLSPLLRRKIMKKNLSAGRVQSVAVRLVVERERAIQAFVPDEWWTIEADLEKKKGARKKPFRATLLQVDGEKADLKTGDQAKALLDRLNGAAYIVSEVRKRDVQRNPAPPFTTSTLQQEASRKLGFTARRTMAVAQQLYEGQAVGDEGTVGLITYMRTDSVNLAETAVAEIREVVSKKYGERYLPDAPRVFRTRSKGAQEAHEAIRPTSAARMPEAVKEYLTSDQYRLYRLVWQRAVACQMAPAVMESTSVDISAAGGLFRATGSTVKFPGFTAVYTEGRDEGEEPEDEGEGKSLPALAQGEELNLVQLLPDQHFTQPPPRFTEATLVKALEEYGIGRPSTYAPTLSTIQDRGYVERNGRQLTPTAIGFIVNDMLVANFPVIVDYEFTAHMEGELDEVAQGEREWRPMLQAFYGPFDETVRLADQNIEVVEFKPEPTGDLCEKCGAPLVVKYGRFGKFIACSAFPTCRNAKPFTVKVGALCPDCGAEIVEKKTRRKRLFYSCSRYPECTFSVWNRPLPQEKQPCPEPDCGGLLTDSGKKGIVCAKCGTVIEDAERETAGAGVGG
jgi:DNA topoisomerase-1